MRLPTIWPNCIFFLYLILESLAAGWPLIYFISEMQMSIKSGSKVIHSRLEETQASIKPMISSDLTDAPYYLWMKIPNGKPIILVWKIYLNLTCILSSRSRILTFFCHMTGLTRLRNMEISNNYSQGKNSLRVKFNKVYWEVLRSPRP